MGAGASYRHLWKTTPGRIVRPRPVTRRVRNVESRACARQGQDLETRNFADIVYEYHVCGRRPTGRRVSIGEDLGNRQVAETLARHPEGTAVLVHDNPANPTEAVPERFAPEGVFRTLIAVLLAGLVAAAIGLPRVRAALAAELADPARALPVLLMGRMALFAALVTFAIGRQAKAARDWPWTEGEILAAGPEQVGLARSEYPYRPLPQTVQVRRALPLSGGGYRPRRHPYAFRPPVPHESARPRPPTGGRLQQG